MSTFTATPEPLNNPPRIRLQVAFTDTGGNPAAVPSATISRRNADGSTYMVRAANPATLNAGQWTGYDYEAPFAQAGVYTVDAGGAAPSMTVSVPMLREYGVQTPWLIHPGIPALSMPITVAQPGPVPVTEVNQGVFNVLGRSRPIIRTDGVRRAPTFTLTVSTYSWDEGDALQAILSNASTLLLQITYPDWERGDCWWVAVGTVTPTNMVDFYGNQYVRWALACTVTGAPLGLLQAQWSCASVVAQYATCADVLASFATCEDLVINNPLAA